MMEVKISKGPGSIIVDEKEQLIQKIEQLEQQRKQAIKLIKDGKFIEVLNLLEQKEDK